MKSTSVLFAVALLVTVVSAINDPDKNPKNATSIYDFTVHDTYDNKIKLDKYKGMVVLIVNIASHCGLTKTNYAQLTDLNKKYYNKGVRILSFPSDQFNQMPEADGDEMMQHVKKAHADVGDVFEKIWVNGDFTEPLYIYLKHKLGGTFGDSIKWNFTKFLVGKNGQPAYRYGPTTNPVEIEGDIEKLLAQKDDVEDAD